tara:strand:- start:745 stop:1581 length:837 start_codon:yes stop_codon:yes gene_type:complete
MKNYEKFSAILPIYKKVDFKIFKKSLESIVNQSLLPNELLIIFDGPIKASIKIFLKKKIKKYKFIKIINFPTNNGLGYILQRAVKLCKYEYIARCDSDDISKLNRFKIQMDFLVKNKKIDVLGSNIIELEKNKFFSLKKVSKNDSQIKKIINFKNPINHSSVIFRKSTIMKCGNYENVNFFEDYYLWFKVYRSNGVFCNLENILVMMKVDDDFFRRRSGFKYYKMYFNFLKKLKINGYIGSSLFLINCILRFFIVLLPIKFMKKFYKTFLRKKITYIT